MIVLNMFKKYKNARYKLTPLRLIFPASVKIETEQIFTIYRVMSKISHKQ